MLDLGCYGVDCRPVCRRSREGDCVACVAKSPRKVDPAVRWPGFCPRLGPPWLDMTDDQPIIGKSNVRPRKRTPQPISVGLHWTEKRAQLSEVLGLMNIRRVFGHMCKQGMAKSP